MLFQPRIPRRLTQNVVGVFGLGMACALLGCESKGDRFLVDVEASQAARKHARRTDWVVPATWNRISSLRFADLRCGPWMVIGGEFDLGHAETSDMRDARAAFYDYFAGGDELVYVNVPYDVTAMDISHDGSLLLTGTHFELRRADLWHVEYDPMPKIRLKRHYAVKGRVTDLTFLHGDSKFLVTDTSLRLWLFASLSPDPLTLSDFSGVSESFSRSNYYIPNGLSGIDCTPDGSLAVISSNGGWHSHSPAGWVVHLPSLEIKSRLGTVRDRAYCVKVAPDGLRAVLGLESGVLLVCDLMKAGPEIRFGGPHGPFGGHHGPIHDLAISPNGKLVASASSDGTVRIWDIETGEEKERLTSDEGIGPPRSRDHPGIVGFGSVSFSPDGRLLVAGSADEWDARICFWKLDRVN